MSQSSTPPTPPNPFAAFAALGAPGASADPMEMMKKFWAPFGLPMPGAGAGSMVGMMFPTTDPAELDKRIADLKSVETWLNLNIEVVRASVQALEMQKSTMAAFTAMSNTMQEAVRANTAKTADTMGANPPRSASRARRRKASE